MDKIKLENYVNKLATIRKIVEETNLSYTTIRYWLKQYNLKTRGKGKLKLHKCLRCGEDDPKNFYGKQKQTCKRCRDIETLTKQREKRKYAITLLGGKCSVCGYNKCINSFDIHHIDPNKKDEKYHRMKSWSLDKIKKELENCILLCANCHREIHDKILNS